MNYLSSESKKKRETCNYLQKDVVKNRTFILRSRMLSRRSLSENAHPLIYGEEYSPEFLTKKLNDLNNKIENIDGKIVSFSGDSEVLLKKKDELQSIILDYRKKIDDLGYLKNLAEKKFSNIESIEFKARETKVF